MLAHSLAPCTSLALPGSGAKLEMISRKAVENGNMTEHFFGPEVDQSILFRSLETLGEVVEKQVDFPFYLEGFDLPAVGRFAFRRCLRTILC